MSLLISVVGGAGAESSALVDRGGSCVSHKPIKVSNRGLLTSYPHTFAASPLVSGVSAITDDHQHSVTRLLFCSE